DFVVAPSADCLHHVVATLQLPAPSLTVPSAHICATVAQTGTRCDSSCTADARCTATPWHPQSRKTLSPPCCVKAASTATAKAVGFVGYKRLNPRAIRPAIHASSSQSAASPLVIRHSSRGSSPSPVSTANAALRHAAEKPPSSKPNLAISPG